jgi:hypothetical protein
VTARHVYRRVGKDDPARREYSAMTVAEINAMWPSTAATDEELAAGMDNYALNALLDNMALATAQWREGKVRYAGRPLDERLRRVDEMLHVRRRDDDGTAA